VQVKQGATPLASYSYDALGRRVIENSGTARDLYYSTGWQVLEERVGTQVQVQQAWSPVYVDALVERDRDADGNAANGLEERLYVQQDANWNVTALVSAAGAVQERYAYDPYGQPSVLAPDWSARVDTLFAWLYRHQGGRYDSASGLYHFRARDYSPALGRWLSVDPSGFVAGDTNLYRYEHNASLVYTDPSGLVGIFFGGAGQPNEDQYAVPHLNTLYKGPGKHKFFEVPAYEFKAGFGLTNPPVWANLNVLNINVDESPALKEAMAMVEEAPKDECVYIFGFSRGAIFAYALSEKLHDAGRKVAVLAVIDGVATATSYKGKSIYRLTSRPSCIRRTSRRMRMI
jgi:RHS repeat-associated protein